MSADPIPLPTVPLGDTSDPRVQRYFAIRRLWQARYDIDCAIGYLQNSDAGSSVITSARRASARLDHLQSTLEWRQRREATP